METQKLNVYIVDDNKMMAGSLRKYLKNRFGEKVDVSLYFSGDSCLRMMHGHIHLVILDYYLNERGKAGKNGVEILKRIKDRFPETEVIMHTSNEDVAVAIEAMKMGAKDYVVKNEHSWNKLLQLVERTITQPIRALVAEFGVPKFMGIFLFTFFVMGAVVFWALKLTHL
ncbi:MAG TPA: response regulator [Bacteroidia bacterium]|jgi:DNA-binding NtrC family response regulator|nr:response regulator [Bacteroidia bacterium]